MSKINVFRSEDDGTILCISTNDNKVIIHGRTIMEIEGSAKYKIAEINRAVEAAKGLELKEHRDSIRSRIDETAEDRKLRLERNRTICYISKKYPTLTEDQRITLYDLSNYIRDIDYLESGLDISLIRKAIFDSKLLEDPKFLGKQRSYQARDVLSWYVNRYFL